MVARAVADVTTRFEQNFATSNRRSISLEKIIRSRPILFRREWNEILKLAAVIIVSASITALGFKLWEHKRHSHRARKEILVKGEVLDMTCYIAYNLSGPEHAECARICIRNGSAGWDKE